MSRIIVVTGGFDPCHEGHVAYLNAARRMGDKLAVGLNSDAWLIRKKGFRFMPWKLRATIIGNLKSVDHTFEFDDSDGSAKDAIEKMLNFFPFHDVVFANGGDRTSTNIPEMDLAGIHPVRLSFAFGVGGENKENSSTNILTEYGNYILGKTVYQPTTKSANLSSTLLSTGVLSIEDTDRYSHDKTSAKVDDASPCPKCFPENIQVDNGFVYFKSTKTQDGFH